VRRSKPKLLWKPLVNPLDAWFFLGDFEVVDTPQLPDPKAMYLESGEEILEYSGSDFGTQPEWSKEFLAGKGIIIRGLSEETYHPDGTAMLPARSVLYNLLEGDPNPTEPWGMFFSDLGLDAQGKEQRDTSTVIKQVRSELRRNGGRPFLVTMEYKDSEAHKGQGYWTLKRFVRNVTPDGKAEKK
jgi:hypothetical protein